MIGRADCKAVSLVSCETHLFSHSCSTSTQTGNRASMATTSSSSPKGFKNVSKRLHGLLRTRGSSKDHGSCTTAATAPPLANALSGLSAEIKQAIFSLLPVASMQALILTCSSLYHCFLDSESAILAKLLQDEIPHSLLQDAFTTFKSSEMTPWNQQTTDNLKILHAAYEKAPLPPKWSLRTATALIEMHSHVEFFANSFASATISQNPVTGHPLPYSGTASPSELVRIKRALYRFEHYCNLSIFRSKHDGGCSSIFARNDRTYAPWENEQLACIREHLLKAVFDGKTSLVDEIRDPQRTDRFSSQKHQRPAYRPNIPPRPGLEIRGSLLLPPAGSQIPTPIRSREFTQRTPPSPTRSTVVFRRLRRRSIRHHQRSSAFRHEQ